MNKYNQWIAKYGVDRIWANPTLDHSLSIKLARVGDVTGEVGFCTISEYTINLPTDSWGQIYQIGNLNPEFVGIELLYDHWYRLDAVINRFDTNIKVYNGKGIIYPLHKVWVREIPNGNMLMCIEMHNQLFDLTGDEDVYCNFYDGNYRYSDDYDSDAEGVDAVSRVIVSGQDKQNAINTYNLLKQKPGNVVAYVDGRFVKNLNNDTLHVWEHVDIVRDGIVKEVIDFKVKDLPTFHSTLDGIRKYLLHPNNRGDIVDNITDVEIHVYDKNMKGCYYYEHFLYDLRQLTHCDYALSVDRFLRMVSDGISGSLNDMTVDLCIRKSGLDQKLVCEHTQIHELYKLPDAGIINAMVGINSTVDEWKAESLESSTYMRWMGSNGKDLTKLNATQLFGYHGMTKVMSDMPIGKLNAHDNVFKLPPLTDKVYTTYEYSSDGILLGVQTRPNEHTNNYVPTNSKCDIIEVLAGAVKDVAPVHWNAKDITLSKLLNYRVYIGRKLNDAIINGEFTDVTGDKSYYTVADDGKVTWLFDTESMQPVVVSDEWIYQYKVKQDISEDGLIMFTVLPDSKVDSIYNFYAPKVLTIFDKHGKTLIPEVDYHVEWPEIAIYSKERFGKTANLSSLEFTVRLVGITDKYVSPKHGYVVGGILSNDTRFDIRDSKVIVPIVDGRVMLRSNLSFREDMGVRISNVENGKPYMIAPTMIPLRDCKDLQCDDYALLARDEEINGRIEEYLSIYIPQTPSVDHNPISKRYSVFSPIMTKVIYDLKHDILKPVEDSTTNFISTELFVEIMKPYMYLLKYEPTRLDIDSEYVYTYPHPYDEIVELTPLEYSIVGRLNSYYLDHKIEFKNMVTIIGSN